jgi:8-oxo-dGTP pyrophosphatase MutT (NUDIX family)
MELNDIYDKNRNLTGRTHRRGTPWRKGEYGLVVCVWVYDGKGKVLLTRRAPEKSFAGTWENSGGAALAGETSLTAIARELREETGITAGDLTRLSDCIIRDTIYHQYLCVTDQAKDSVTLQPGETIGYRWLSEEAFAAFVNSGEMIPSQRERFRGYLSRMGYLR